MLLEILTFINPLNHNPREAPSRLESLFILNMRFPEPYLEYTPQFKREKTIV